MHLAPLALSLAALALCGGCTAADKSPRTRSADPSDSPTPTDDTGDAPDGTVSVGHTREMRGLYVASVYNIDWPSSSDASAATQRDEIAALLDVAWAAGLNAVFVQLRPEGDALYHSAIEPWSRWLTGTQGIYPGYDPLETWIAEARARGIEVHAWLNPYRAKVGSESTSGLAAGHMALDYPQYAHAYGGDVWMDPGASEVQQRVRDVIADLLAHYDLDGIHFDDYFYPYPDDGEFPDDATWNAYENSGGTLSRDDWRRSNTAALVQAVSEDLDARAPGVRFGIAPFGIWRPGYPEGISGFDAYASLYADPVAWAQAGWVDYLAPQLYWETGNSGQEYAPLAAWWDAQLPPEVELYPANALYQYGTGSTWTLDEFAAQIAICRDEALAQTHGNLWYNASPLLDDAAGLREAFATRYYPTPALPPAVRDAPDEPEPELIVDGATVRWSEADGRRAITVYAAEGDAWTLTRIVPAAAGEVTLTAGRWALASVGRGDAESRGVVVDVP